MKKLSLRWACGLAFLFVLLGHAAGYYSLGFIDSFDNLIYDTRLRMTMPGTPDDRIIIVDIDEKSLAQVGRWPWSRDRMAELVDKLFRRDGVVLIGFDVVMPEPDRSSGLDSLESLAHGPLLHNAAYLSELEGLRGQLDYDARFAHALEARPVVLGYYFAVDAAPSGALPAPLALPSDVSTQLVDWPSYGANLPAFQRAGADGGFFNPVVDFDGNVRRVALLARYRGQTYESLSLAMVRALLGEPPVTLDVGDSGSTGQREAMLEAIELHTPRGILHIPVDEQGAALVPYRGYERTFRYVSASDVLSDRVPLAQLQGRIVLVGTSAPGLVDLRSTPVGRAYPGVEIHANLIAGMLDGAVKHAPGYTNAAQVVVLILVGLLMIFFFPWRSPWRATGSSAVLLLAAVAGDLALWRQADWAVPLASTVVLISGLFVWNMSLGYFAEYRTKRQFADLFGQYVPPELVDEMTRQPDRYSMEGRRAELTVLFSDVRGFTTISEALEPEQLAHLMNEYFDAMTATIRSYRGTLDKYIGDAIMAFWGAPVADSDHAHHAVLTALGMQAALAGLNPKLTARGWPALEIGIGLNTGPVTVGDMGSTVRKAYTVIGDAVNLAARLEGVTKHYGVGIVVGEATRASTPRIAYRELDRVRVKGKSESVAIYEPLGEEVGLSPAVHDELQRWHDALACYQARDWQAAAARVAKLAADYPHRRLYAVYLERIDQLRTDEPSLDWDGIYAFESK